MAMLPAAGTAAKRMAPHAPAAARTSSKPALIQAGTTDLGDGAYIDYHPKSLPRPAALFQDVDREATWASGKVRRDVCMPRHDAAGGWRGGRGRYSCRPRRRRPVL